MELRARQWDKPSLANTPTPLQCGQHCVGGGGVKWNAKKYASKNCTGIYRCNLQLQLLPQLPVASAAAAVTVAFGVHSKVFNCRLHRKFLDLVKYTYLLHVFHIRKRFHQHIALGIMKIATN